MTMDEILRKTFSETGKFMKEILKSLLYLVINASISLPIGYFIAKKFNLDAMSRFVIIVIISVAIGNAIIKTEKIIKERKWKKDLQNQ